MERKVVITGMGIWSCLGKTLEDVRDSLYTGKSGIIFSQERKDAGLRSALCADLFSTVSMQTEPSAMSSTII